MTHKTHPTSNRLVVTKGWKSRWFSAKNYQIQTQQDYLIRRFIQDNFKNAGIAEIEMERSPNVLSIIVYTSRPGILIGRGGTGVEDLKKQLVSLLKRKVKLAAVHNSAASVGQIPEIRIDVNEVANADSNARLIALNIAEQLERRMPFRRVIKRALDRVMANKGVKGAKISIAGRLNGAEMARREFVKEGSLPLQTLRADIDYAYAEAITKYGVIGVKVWVHKGEK